MKSTINVYGLGYIGLPTAATFANVGYQVLGVDICPEVVRRINSGDTHIQEPGLHLLVHSALQCRSLSASLTPAPAEVHIIAVPTPVSSNLSGGMSPDLSYVEAATRTIAAVLKYGDLVVLESTVPPNTCLQVVAPLIYQLIGLRHGEDYDLAHCPERVIPGSMMREIIANDRIIGGTTPEATRRTVNLYASFTKGRLLATDATTAEMCKLMENTFRDVNIALANEFAAISERLGIDAEEAIRLANHHPRVNIHAPGIGVGGHCIPVDPWFLVAAAPDVAPLMRTARSINDARPQQVADDILQTMRQYPGKAVTLLGLSYKADVDDIRESPALEIAHRIAANTTAPLYVVEPYLSRLPPALRTYANIQFVTLEHALEAGEIIVGLVGHSVFRQISVEQLQYKLRIDPLYLWAAQTDFSAATAVCRTRDEQTNKEEEYVPALAA